MISRRTVILAGSLLGSAMAGQATSTGAASDFVRVAGQRFLLSGREYRYVGTNMWYGAYLGAAGPTSNRLRLKRELDSLSALGVNNLRILGSSEDSPLKNSIKPTFRGPTQAYNEDLLVGLDFLLAEMAKRDMKAVIYLNNFWEWTGGMMTYLYWANGGQYIDMNDPSHPWPAFAEFTARFYSNAKANALFREYVRAVVNRQNTITCLLYRDDPTIMSWQLANEPRPGGNLATADLGAFYAWVAETAGFIKSLDPNHLVSTGNEGIRGCLDSEDCTLRMNSASAIDYITFHIWPLNWSWINPADMGKTYPACEANTRVYIESHIKIAERLNKPLVAEEFGFPRDGGVYALSTTATYRDRYYGLVFGAALESAKRQGPFAGTNFWAWGGQGRAQHSDFMMGTGDANFVGDPPQEPQGRNSVFDCDASTLAVVREHAQTLASVAPR
jgi:mannan endo-1,4-beta-mannosidase